MNNSEKQHYTNRLIHETSPYLLQHAHNPVDWYPWGDEAFEKAQKENKLVLVSIGYAACHWCHVMEHESFENEEVAILMNEKYVCVKVDREERPDVDQIYMTAVQMITGSGGWPLNCFVLPDRRPIYGGTYFRPNDWKNVLIGLDATHKTEPEKIEKAANEISHGIVQSNLIEANSGEHVFLKEDIRPSIDAWEKQFDELWGGTDGAPKFPMPSGLEFLQSYAFYHNDPVVESHFMHTLNKIAYGGIYDQVGGGFARYSVDAEWKAPHFEKMLYDNAQLLSVYAKAYQQNPEVLYEKTILQTIAFLEREMYAKGTAFYASYDADSEGVEGKFYVWTELELKNILKTSEYWVLDYYNVRPEGNWEGHNILWITQHEEMLHELNIDEQTFYKKLEAVNAKIIKEREKRIYPGLDNKILTEWNALLGMAYLDVFLALGDEKYLNQAKALASFYQQSVIQESGMVYRNYTNGKANIEGVLNDYALLTRFYIKLYQHTVNKDYLVLSLRLLNYVETHFFDAQSQLFFYTNVNAKDLITRSIEISDNVIPSSNAVMAHNLLDLSIILGETRYREMSEQMLQNVWPKVKSSLPYFSYWASLWLRLSENQYEVVVYGEEADSYLAEMKKAYHPNVFFIGSKSLVENSPLFENRWVEGETLIYVCKDNVCQLPVESVEEAMKLLKHNF